MNDKNWQDELEIIDRRDRVARNILGVNRDANKQQIRSAYIKACLTFHPDRNPDNPEAARNFKLIHLAYLFLFGGQDCPELDKLDQPKRIPQNNHYKLDNSWGYFCWWQDMFF